MLAVDAGSVSDLTREKSRAERALKKLIERSESGNARVAHIASAVKATPLRIRNIVKDNGVSHDIRVSASQKEYLLIDVASFRDAFRKAVSARKKSLMSKEFTRARRERTSKEALAALTFDNAEALLFMQEAIALTGISQHSISAEFRSKSTRNAEEGVGLIDRDALREFYEMVQSTKVDVSDLEPEDYPPYLSTAQVATILEITQPSAANYINHGALPRYRRLIRENIVKREDLIEFMKRHPGRRGIKRNHYLAIKSDSKRFKLARRVIGNTAIRKRINNILQHDPEKNKIHLVDIEGVSHPFKRDDVTSSLKELNEALSKRNNPTLIALGISYEILRNRQWKAGKSIK